MREQKYSNRLADEKSPYLLQHAHNPVNWYPWGDEAFLKARDEDKPIFLSIGYSTCHWCHVMERESFEDEEVAQALNKDYISIKVDREERPDIDHIYMTVCQALTGHGGWPLTILMTPEKKPFFAGTYYPKNDSMGIPGLLTLLARASDAWKNKRQALLESSEKISSIFDDAGPKGAMPSSDLAETAFSYYERSFDDKYGGFGSQPKFPTPHNLLFLLRYWHTSGNRNALLMAEKTLESMKAGGIYDHIGFGFSRYSTDNKWLVPHFEKMLYDNALLAIAYLEAYQASKKEIYSDTANEIFTYILRDMTSPEGGFYSAEDADSEGEEGKFYVWTPEEVIQILGSEDGQKFCSLYDITPKGNFEGKSIPNLISSDISPKDRIWADQCRAKLFYSREKRVHPYKDDKILTGWNGLMIAALAIGGRVLGNENYTQAAEKAFRFISGKMLRDDGRLMARYRDGQTAHLAYADDYSFLIWGLIELYETTFKPEYLEKAVKLNDDLIRLFYDSRNGGLFIYGSDSEQLLARPKDSYDGALPSANSVSAYNLIKLSRLTGDHKLEEKAKDIMMAFGSELEHHPTGHSFMMSALLYLYSKAIEVVISGVNRTEDKAMLDILAESYRPFTLFVYYNPESDNLTEIVPFLSAYKTIDDKTTAYVCENYSCKPPVNDISTLREYLTFIH